MESPRISTVTTSQGTNCSTLKTKWLLCPKCSKNIPTIVTFIKEEIPSIVLECQCGNNQILSLEEYLNIPTPVSPHQCDSCNDNNKRNDTLYCLMCMKWLCPECITKHNMMDSTKEHNFIRSEVLMRSKCSLHTDKFNISYCYTCERGVCKSCLNGDHKEHDTVQLSELHNSLSIGIEIERINEGINSIMKQREDVKNSYIKMVDNYIDTLQRYKSQIISEHESNKNKNNQFAELINILYSNYESTQLYPNYNIIRNLEINCSLNIKDFEPTDYQNFALYTRELLQFFKSVYILNFNISTTYEKITGITEYWVSKLLPISMNIFASSSMKDIKLWNCKSYKCITTFSGHSQPITNIIKLNNKNQIASCSYDKTIKIWSTIEPYKCIATLTGHKAQINTMTQLKDNRLISISEDGTVITWDVDKQKVLKLFYIEQSIHLVTELSNSMIAVDSRALIKLYNTNTFSKTQFLIGHSDEISSLLLLSNGKLASGSKDKTIKIWNVEQQICEKTFKGNEDKVVNLTQLKDGTLLSSCSDGSINMWEVEIGHKLFVLNRKRISAIAFIQMDDEIVFSSSKESIDIWKIKSNKKAGIADIDFRLFC